MVANLSKPSVPTSTTPTDVTRHYVPRNGQIVRLPWSALTDAEREDLRKADERAYQVVLFGIYA